MPPAPGSAWADGIRVDVGTMIPLWLPHLHDRERYELIFVRRVGIGTDKLYQGFVVNWPALRDSLLDEARDLLAEAELVRVLPHLSGVDPAGRYLANLPVALIAPAPAPPASVGLTPARTTLGLAWLLAIVAALAAAARRKFPLSAGAEGEGRTGRQSRSCARAALARRRVVAAMPVAVN